MSDLLLSLTLAQASPQAPSGWEHFLAVLPALIRGAGITICVAAVAEAIGICIGLSIALIRLHGPWFLRWPCLAYVDIIRGTPLLVQILFLYFGVPALMIELTGRPFSFELGMGGQVWVQDAIVAGTLACGLNSGAYLSEIYRAALRSIDPGQSEAARSLGLGRLAAFRFVIAPQALVRALPPMGNELITLLKDTSLLSVIAVTEIVRTGQLYAARTYAVFPTYVAIAATYFVLVFTVSRLVNRLDRRLATGTQR